MKHFFNFLLISNQQKKSFPSIFKRIKINQQLNILTKYFSQQIIYPAATRNSAPILEVLSGILSKTIPNQKLLEISSGSGQHTAYFAPHFPNIEFQPTEYDPGLLGSIEAYAKTSKNIYAPVIIDIRENYKNWNFSRFNPNLLTKIGDLTEQFDYILNINMIHISPFSCTERLFWNASHLLKRDGYLITYGPYAVDGVIKPQSNIDFDRSLRERNPEWGLRDIADLKVLGDRNGLAFQKYVDMPANNKICIWKKKV